MRVAFETARLSLARHVVSGEQARQKAVAHAVAVSAAALSVERVGLWYFDDAEHTLTCQCLYTLSTKSVSQGELLEAERYPIYVAALRNRRVIAAARAREYRLTAELAASYFEPHGIVSVLYAPIISAGRVIGVAAHEHLGEEREFSQQELDFVSSVADMVALIDEQSSRLSLEAALREQEERMQRAAKLEALGRLARTAAHDFNNVLTVLMGSAEDLSKHLDAGVRERATRMLDAAEVGKRIAQELLVMGRDSPATPRAVSLFEAIDAVEPILRARFGPQLSFHCERRLENPIVLADPAQIQRILLNLGLNAGEACEGKGQIEVLVREPTEAEASGRGWLALEVVDDGIGMSDDVKAHLFEPYFTTKPSGTGLGLASVYGIVRQLKGRVHVESVHGHGTRFVVVLPKAEVS